MSIYSAVNCGNLHLIPQDERNTDWDLDDSGVATSFGTDSADFSGNVPSGTKALLVYIQFYSNDTNDWAILYTRGDGESSTDAHQTVFSSIGAEIGATGYRMSAPDIIYAPNGKFDYYCHATYSINELRMIVMGYYR
jgi:hypothetical protein